MIRGNKKVQIGDYVLALEDEEDLDNFYIEKARNELRETPEIRTEAVQELKKRLQNTEGLILPMTDDSLPTAYLRTCKFDIDATYDKILTSYKYRAKYPHYFENLNKESERAVLVSNLFTILPFRDQHGRRNLVIEIGKKWDTKEISLTQIVRGVLVLIEIAQLEPKTQISGGNIIFDLNGLSLNHIWQFTPSFASFIIGLVQKYLPLRLKSIHVVNQPSIFNMLFAIFKPFLYEKLRKRIFFHGTNMSSLTEHIIPKCLPKQYGGLLNIDSSYADSIYKLICEHDYKIQEVTSRRFVLENESNKKKSSK